MISCEQIDFFERELKRVLADFQNTLSDSEFKETLEGARKYAKETCISVGFLRAKNQRLINQLHTYMLKGFTRENAKKLLLTEFDYEPITVARLVEDTYIRYKHKMRGYNIYAAQMMKKAGMTNKKIAITLGVCPAAVTAFLKVKPVDVEHLCNLSV